MLNSVFVFATSLYSTVVIYAQRFCTYGEPLNKLIFGIFFSFTQRVERVSILMILDFYAVAVELCYHVYKIHIYGIFQSGKKKLDICQKKLRGIKTGATKSQNVVELFCWGGGEGLIHFYLDFRELSINY